ncbi:MAG: AAA family ATPase [Planctomycetaceae bacterium]
MHIRRLKIENFRAIGSLELPFDDKMGHIRPITVLAGPNGCGKTSVLFAIVQALRGSLRARIPDVPNPSDDDLHRAEPSGRRPVTATVDLELNYEDEELAAIKQVFNETQVFREKIGKGPLYPPDLPGGRLKLHWQYPPPIRRDGTRELATHLGSDPDHGFVWLNGPSAAWRGWKSRLLQSVTDMYPVGMLSVFPQDRDRRWGIDIDDTDEQTDVDRTVGPVDPRNGHPEAPTVAEALRRLGEWAHGQGLPEGDDRRNWESQLQAQFKRICAPKKYKGYWLDHARYGETPLLEDQGKEYPFRSAASGELVILHYLTKFTFPRPVHNSLILIDEPELHLHPRWIGQLYRALPLMGDNNQFILVTHSAELRQLAARDNALIDLGDLGREGTHAG